MYRSMHISALAVDTITKSPIVLLKEIDGEKTLPIWIGLLEANAIAVELEGIHLARPMTHDLLKNILEMIGVKVVKVEITELKNNTFYALIHIQYKKQELTIDARPSDALALSLRVGAPIFVAEEVIESALRIEFQAEPEDKSEQGKAYQEILEKADPEDFGNT